MSCRKLDARTRPLRQRGYGILRPGDTGVWACNWPHPQSGGGAMPYDAVLLDLLLDWAPDAKTRNRILAANPAELYGFQ